MIPDGATFPFPHKANAWADVRVVDQKKRWVLASPWWPIWWKDGALYCMPIPRGFAYDGSSVPRLLWWLVAPFELGIEAPGKHDWFHENKGLVEVWRWNPKANTWESLGRVQWSRRDADRMFFRDMRENKRPIPKAVRRGAFKAVRFWSRMNGDEWK